MLTRSGMKARYEKLYANGIMYLAKDEPELAIKYFKGAAMQLKEYVQGLCDEEQDEMRDWLLEMVAHVRELEKYIKLKSKRSSSVKVQSDEKFAFDKSEIPNVSLSDVIGLDEVKSQIYDKILYPRRYKELYKKFNKKVGGGILLYGPPGNGKTMIAKAIANETESTFFSIKFSDLGSKWFGETEGKIKALFDEARKEESAVIFFDEIDSIASKRNNDTIANRMVAELLTQLDGINRSSGNVTVIAATNRPDILDRAIIRPGRFDEKIYVPLPDMQTRQLMFEKHLNGIPCQITSYVRLANNTEGFSGAEIEYVCEKAKQSVIRSIIAGAPENTNITEADIMRAISGVRVA